jgi:hypothetical protein
LWRDLTDRIRWEPVARPLMATKNVAEAAAAQVTITIASR